MKNVFLFFCGLAIVALLFFSYSQIARSAIGDCPAGYEWQRMSGVGCVQINCASVPDGHYSYTSQCICGSSGSETENPADPNQECYYPADYASCPGCLYACTHFDEQCLAISPDSAVAINTNAAADTNTTVNTNAAADQNTNSAVDLNVNSSLAESSVVPLLTAGTGTARSCVDECNKYLRGKTNATVTLAEGEYPGCRCQIDIRGPGSELTQTVSVEGPIETTYIYDPASGDLIGKNVVNRQNATEIVRQRLGYRYTEEQIDQLLDPTKIDQWFNDQIAPVVTSTGLTDPQFWWQHVVAILDHGFSGNSADFVDTYHFGRCGDSMEWLERNLTSQLHLGDDPNEPGQQHLTVVKFSSAVLGDEFKNLINKYNKARQKRNKFIYEMPDWNISREEAVNTLATAREYLKQITRLIEKNNPQLRLKL